MKMVSGAMVLNYRFQSMTHLQQIRNLLLDMILKKIKRSYTLYLIEKEAREVWIYGILRLKMAFTVNLKIYQRLILPLMS